MLRNRVGYIVSMMMMVISFCFSLFYLFIFIEGKGETKTRRETSLCGCLSPAPYWGPDQQPRHVPWLGMKPMTLWFTGRYLIHWTTAARDRMVVILIAEAIQPHLTMRDMDMDFVKVSRSDWQPGGPDL